MMFPASPATRGAHVRTPFISIAKSFTTPSEGMNRAARNIEPRDPGACRRR
jgi:hypothetical protein